MSTAPEAPPDTDTAAQPEPEASAASTGSADAIDLEMHYPSGEARVDKKLLTLPKARGANTGWWGNPIYLHIDFKKREAAGRKGAHYSKCGKDLT